MDLAQEIIEGAGSSAAEDELKPAAPEGAAEWSDAEKDKAREALAFFLDDDIERGKRDKNKIPVGRMNREEQALFDKSHPKASKGPVSARQIGAALQMPALCTPAQARARLAEMDREGRR